MEILIMQSGHPFFEKTARAAETCSWRAGPALARRMRANAFAGPERVIAAVDGEKVAGFCTFALRDSLAEGPDFSPFAGFVFVDEGYRGHRLSERMIDCACRYAGQQGYRALHVLSGESGLYEKYGFEALGAFLTDRGERDTLYKKALYPCLLETTLNTRDLGGLPAAGGLRVLPGRVWRSDAPTRPCAPDARRLRDRGITTVIDLRSGPEKERKPCVLAGAAGFEYHSFPLLPGSVPPETLREVPESYLAIASAPETAAALRCAAGAEGGVLVCCTAGKDRTGVFCALVLLALGADPKTIAADYGFSRVLLRERLEKYLEAHPETDPRIVLADEASMTGFLTLFQARYGGFEGWAGQAGLSPEVLRRLRQKLLGGESPKRN